ncbi:universal stress protein [Sulfolobus sp. A20-N-F6]|uniref:universal stress protein n=1 Tax=Sulfolobaceae TaxID=118883 RepID=UPI000845CD67|nr:MULTISPECIES: universal stress protein [unclassified Sulfolobus]TRM76847.1 universal stress protein [Sulfolobus sp. E5]TRM77255.1 universal stress protein [Sulfolobus sp. A20-N-F8]TRM84254.1 universal stress protein [Sulfolobus sp. A20-N-F6]TRM84894.1 universal stress protein [Sulfolobus sp. F3]TRN04747.1 universal stress protein [Sulfolobus sp. E1]
MKVVVAFDGSDRSKKALFFVIRLIKSDDEIHLVTVIKEAPKSPEQVIIESEKKASEMQNEVIKELEGYRVVSKILESNEVAEALIQYCNNIGCDLIVSGSRGLTGIKKAILGSVSSELVSKANVPVLVVK